MKRRVFLIPSLLAAGFLPVRTDAMPLDPIVKKPDPHSILERLKIRHLYSLAGHRSHSSHSSHSSHRSSGGGGYLPSTTYSSPSYSEPSPPPPPRYTAPTYSPPAALIAPTPAPPPAAPQQMAPAKTLPGNSNKFRRIVIQVQSGLTAYGYYAGALTGVVDEDTRAALSQMQKDNNLKITGTVTTEVLNAFGIAAQ
ncbi:His-Xaa-Ser repeat protein HxsA [Rhizobium leguminosarum bv. viciae]|uniref:His-Xaa-Ser repeat protein HxsA n=1 Tax=Rhizobium leguminosarum TaxID=384 RepID=UPI001040D9BB|nr:His-Xaa-Ser repeat protein HxsA [Rhizobium leguminosarum]MBY5530123.1 His-Xaa-Ser repeat protein HxsA [Rhizobium leguminosarum]TBY25234.1 His-Xaa-Ser repeat protein HxsA [Rhizobium leguminosarum bv. viciae]TBY35785.1 His-Xaa-Ser repeat protein HxsA [Rhizobium leguminosarum bv. viciae]TCB00607.1 His-Xaa-Ser repeat protein HxsA [Rhizobium leguminosarum bv. viciae]